jgi:hypothetical protein
MFKPSLRDQRSGPRIRFTKAPLFRAPKYTKAQPIEAEGEFIEAESKPLGKPAEPLLMLHLPSKDDIIQQQDQFQSLLLPPTSPKRASATEKVLGPCTVCYEDVCEKENVTACLHILCRECAGQWATGQCPVCKAGISKEFLEEKDIQEQVESKRQLESKRTELLNYLTAYLYEQVAPMAESIGARFVRRVNDLIYTIIQTDLEQVLDIDVLLASDLSEDEIQQQIKLYLEPLFIQKYNTLMRSG